MLSGERGKEAEIVTNKSLDEFHRMGVTLH
jgi:hypothetical protein